MSHWPLSEGTIRDLALHGESSVLEYKREWYDLDGAEGKANFAKDALALANSVAVGAHAYLMVGVRDSREGGGICGVTSPPEPERLAGILSGLTLPPVAAQFRNHTLSEGVVSIVEITGSPSRPHHATREYQGVIARNTVYVRRDSTVGLLSLPEIEDMIREKHRLQGPLAEGDAVTAGFVGNGSWDGSRTLVASVANVSADPVGGVEVTFDVRVAGRPGLFYRVRKLTNSTLEAGEAREVEFRLSEATFWVPAGQKEQRTTVDTIRDFGTHTIDRWLDFTLRVLFRDRDGYIKELTRDLSVEW